MVDWKEKFLNKQVCGDNLKLLKELPDSAVHLCVTSPPYNVDLGYDIYRDHKSYEFFLSSLEKRFRELQRVLVIGGKVAINVADAGKPLHSDIIQFMTKKLQFKHIATVIWTKGGRSNSPIFGSFDPSAPVFAYPFEFIVVFSKGGVTRNVLKGSKTSTITREEYLKYSTCLWEFPGEHRMKSFGHKAMFPVELPKRFIHLLTWKEDTVIDIYAGAGSTAYAAQEAGRNFISFDLSEKYCNTANERLGLNQKSFEDYL